MAGLHGGARSRLISGNSHREPLVGVEMELAKDSRVTGILMQEDFLVWF